MGLGERRRKGGGVLEGVLAAFDAGLGLGVAVEAAKDHFGVGFWFGEFGFGLDVGLQVSGERGEE